MTVLFAEALYEEEAFQGFTVWETLYDGHTPYQKVQIFDTKFWGRVLILDDIVQTTEKDEFMYHEMLVHVPMFACEKPRHVMIIGGGDGGALREVLKHDVEHVDMVEIDREVVGLCCEYLPSLNNHGAVFEDPRANLVIEDAFEFLQRENRRYDVIIVDSTDPVGAGEVLFSREFYALCGAALHERGVLSLQGGVVFLQPEEPRQSMQALRELGLHATCITVAVPTYYGGYMTLGMASPTLELLQADTAAVSARFERANFSTKHYTPQVHVASFTLPRWIEELTGGLK